MKHNPCQARVYDLKGFHLETVHYTAPFGHEIAYGQAALFLARISVKTTQSEFFRVYQGGITEVILPEESD